ncbi:MAG TPA: four helix bundle protein [Anaerolineales bacterium]
MGNYQELIFYQKARQVVKGVDALVKSWPKTMQAQEISRQLFRSATSVGANIAEGHGRHQGTEYVHYLIIAQGSANETEHWLHTAQDCGLGPIEKIEEILRLNNEVVRMITSTIGTIRSKQGSKSVQENHAYYTPGGNVIVDD